MQNPHPPLPQAAFYLQNTYLCDKYFLTNVNIWFIIYTVVFPAFVWAECIDL